MFVTAKKSSAPLISEDPADGNTPGTSSSSTPAEEDRDILEEDLTDLNYTPYPKTGAGRGKRGRPPKT